MAFTANPVVFASKRRIKPDLSFPSFENLSQSKLKNVSRFSYIFELYKLLLIHFFRFFSYITIPTLMLPLLLIFPLFDQVLFGKNGFEMYELTTKQYFYTILLLACYLVCRRFSVCRSQLNCINRVGSEYSFICWALCYVSKSVLSKHHLSTVHRVAHLLISSLYSCRDVHE